MNPEETLAVWRAEESEVRERLARTTSSNEVTRTIRMREMSGRR